MRGAFSGSSLMSLNRSRSLQSFAMRLMVASSLLMVLFVTASLSCRAQMYSSMRSAMS